ncbi:hypothetical protein [Streptomyces sp. NBC_00198]|uniref:hypothetical protein n=1 Tax=Streptomyces sp. NBC_00198 TaxID=2975677 RepID=UPI002257C65F|nr:hypothetical protein [Streptomyces sp. NBC_00198]MCX5285678.1 hypothetical protein [Streptomyces sp. NBC_00198]MCX5286220.1 hypothetical protein [Streptomyces sp. NBC_00198]
MPGNNSYTVTTAKITLTASATKSLILLAPGTPGLRLTELGVSFDGSSALTGVQIDLYRVATIGSPAGTTTTPAKLTDENATSAVATALTALTTEPTSVTILRSWMISPFGGALVLQEVLDREVGAITSGARLGLRYTTAASVTPGCVAYLGFTE